MSDLFRSFKPTRIDDCSAKKNKILEMMRKQIVNRKKRVNTESVIPGYQQCCQRRIRIRRCNGSGIRRRWNLHQRFIEFLCDFPYAAVVAIDQNAKNNKCAGNQESKPCAFTEFQDESEAKKR